jgi:hypothetical protein
MFRLLGKRLAQYCVRLARLMGAFYFLGKERISHTKSAPVKQTGTRDNAGGYV